MLFRIHFVFHSALRKLQAVRRDPFSLTSAASSVDEEEELVGTCFLFLAACCQGHVVCACQRSVQVRQTGLERATSCSRSRTRVRQDKRRKQRCNTEVGPESKRLEQRQKELSKTAFQSKMLSQLYKLLHVRAMQHSEPLPVFPYVLSLLVAFCAVVCSFRFLAKGVLSESPIFPGVHAEPPVVGASESFVPPGHFLKNARSLKRSHNELVLLHQAHA